MSSHEPDRDDRLGDALADLPVPEHGPTFWAELDHRLQGERVQQIESRELHLPPPGDPGHSDPNPDPSPLAAETVSLEEERARRATRRASRPNRHLGAAAAAVALVVAVAGALNLVRDDDTGSDVRAADRPTGTAPGPSPSTTAPIARAPFGEFSATYDGIEGLDGPDGCCSQWRLTLAQDGSYRWTSTDGKADVAYDVTAGRHVEVMPPVGGSSKDPQTLITTGVPAGGPDRRVARPDPLDPIADFVAGLARANDPRITTRNVAGRAAWHYEGPTVKDRLGGDGTPDNAVADVDTVTGVLLTHTTKVGDLVVNSFTASGIATSDVIDRSRYRLDPPAGSHTAVIGFVSRSLDEAATGLPYELLVPNQVPHGFGLESVQVDRDVASPTGPEGMNPPAKQIVAMTWHDGVDRFTVTLRPKGPDQWDDPFGAEGMVPDDQPVVLRLAGRAPLNASVVVDAPFIPHLWGISEDIVVTVSGDLPRADLERVAGSLEAHRT